MRNAVAKLAWTAYWIKSKSHYHTTWKEAMSPKVETVLLNSKLYSIDHISKLIEKEKSTRKNKKWSLCRSWVSCKLSKGSTPPLK